MTPEELKAIDDAVAAVRHRLLPEDRFDLRQELALKLISGKETAETLFNAACDWVGHLLRDQKRRSDLLKNGPKAQRRTGNLWEPKWYPPHEKACEFAPFACRGARIMTVKSF